MTANDPVVLMVFFAATVVLWAVFLLLVVLIVKGRAHERAEHLTRIRGQIEQHGAYGDGPQHR